MITEEQMTMLENVCREIAQSPLKVTEDVPSGILDLTDRHYVVDDRHVIACAEHGTAKFMAEAVTAIPELVASVRNLQKQVEFLADCCVKFGDKKPRESTEYWIGASKRELLKK